MRSRRKEPFPSKRPLIRLLDAAIYIASLASPVILYPQVAEAFTTHNVAGLSLTTWTGLGIINLIWALYGLVHRSYPNLVAGIGAASMQLSVAVAILLYR